MINKGGRNMSILEEDKLNEIKEKFSKLDFQDPDFIKKIEEIINESLIENEGKIGKTIEAETVDEHMEKTQDCFKELEDLQGEGILDQIEDEELRESLSEQATKGIEDEVIERESLKEAGLLEEAMKETTPEDILEEILKQLEKMIEEKKEAIDKKIEENEAMRKKVIERERLRISRTKVSNLQQKTKELKGTEGKKLNQNVQAAVEDFDKQLADLVKQTSCEGVEITEAELEEENKKLEEEKKSLDDILQKIKESYQEKDAQKAKLVLMKKKMNDVIQDITPDMTKEELEEKARLLVKYYGESNKEMKKELERMWAREKITIKRQDEEGQEQENTVTVMDMMNVLLMNTAREKYMKEMAKTEVEQSKINIIKGFFESGKKALEVICNEEVLPLQTEEEYIEEFENLEKDAQKTGFFGKGKVANKVAKKLQKIYDTIAPFIGEVEAKGIRPAYHKIAKIVRNNESIKEENLPPAILPENKHKEKNEKAFVPKVDVDVDKIHEGLDKFADETIEQEGQDVGEKQEEK